MAIGTFMDKTHPPSNEELSEALGSKQPLWEALTRFIEASYQLPSEFSYGGKNYGWNLWYRRSGKSLATLYPQKESFVAQVVLGKEQVEKALNLELGENVGKVLRNTPQFHDGRWLFIPVTTERDVEDIKQLILLKKRPSKPK
jgi:hypothetical protein